MKKKNRVTNPIAHADGGVSEGLGKKLNTNTTATKTRHLKNNKYGLMLVPVG